MPAKESSASATKGIGKQSILVTLLSSVRPILLFNQKDWRAPGRNRVLHYSILKHFVHLTVNLFLNIRRTSVWPLLNRHSITSIYDMLNKGSSTQLIPRKSKNTILLEQILKLNSITIRQNTIRQIRQFRIITLFELVTA